MFTTFSHLKLPTPVFLTNFLVLFWISPFVSIISRPFKIFIVRFNFVILPHIPSLELLMILLQPRTITGSSFLFISIPIPHLFPSSPTPHSPHSNRVKFAHKLQNNQSKMSLLNQLMAVLNVAYYTPAVSLTLRSVQTVSVSITPTLSKCSINGICNKNLTTIFI
jgi:hypothetical protein